MRLVACLQNHKPLSSSSVPGNEQESVETMKPYMGAATMNTATSGPDSDSDESKTPTLKQLRQ